jgi:hypothetical protein
MDTPKLQGDLLEFSRGLSNRAQSELQQRHVARNRRSQKASMTDEERDHEIAREAAVKCANVLWKSAGVRPDDFHAFILDAIKRAKSEDKERLDWLESTPFTAYRGIDPEHGPDRHFTIVDETMPERRGIVTQTLRAAIDAARKQ